MKVIDPGHEYALDYLDARIPTAGCLRFVKRVGEGYPGNEGPAYAGTNMQEVLRALIDRLKYVREQALQMNDESSAITDMRCIWKLRDALYCLEARAARRHGRESPAYSHHIKDEPVCSGCGHIGCEGGCGRVS